jgi:hypothetical protein
MSPTGSDKRVRFSITLILPCFSVKKILPSSAISIALGACNPRATTSTPLEFDKLLEFDTGDGKGTRVSDGENFMVNMLIIITRAEGITRRISCLLSISCIRLDFL